MKKVFGVFFAVIVAMLLSGCSVVGPSERGVRYSMGKVDDTPLSSGTYLWVPYFAGLQTLDVAVSAIEIKTSSGTKDQQEVTTTAVVNVQVDPAQVVNVVKNYGSEEALYKQIIPQIQEAINANVSKFSAEEVLTKRTELKESIDKMIKERAAKYGATVHDISIKDLQYSKEYADAVERKQIAEQKSKQAQYDAERAIKEADAERNRARGKADAQNLMKLTVTPAILQQQAIEKWDGKFPQYMGAGTLPFLNLSVTK